MPGFRSLTLSALGLLAVLAAGHYALVRKHPPDRASELHARLPLSLWKRLVHLGLGSGFLVLAATGFLPALAGGERLGGYLLLLHFLGAGLFLPSLALAALAWAVPEERRRGRLDRGLFWSGLALGLAASLSSLLAMTPHFTPAEIEGLREAHRGSALALLLVVLLHTYLTVILRPGGLGLLWTGRKGLRPGIHDRTRLKPEREGLR